MRREFLLWSLMFSLLILFWLPGSVHAGAIWRGEASVVREPPPTASVGIFTSFRRFLLSKLAAQRPPIGTTFIIQSSAYASSPYQTDNTPCITAAGTRVRPGVVASNFLPLGAILEIKGQRFIVEDRMNPRYNGRFVDIWFPSTAEALEFGLQRLPATIIDYGVPGQDISPAVSAEENLPPIKPSVIKRASFRFLALTRSIARLIPANVNRYDVNCFD